MICHRIFGFSGDCQVNVNVDFCMISSWLFSRMLSILMKVLFFIFIFVSFDDFSFPTSIEYYTTYKHSLTFDQIFINSLPFSKIQSFISSLLFYLLLNHKIESYFLEKQTIQHQNKQFNNQGYLNHLQHSCFLPKHHISPSNTLWQTSVREQEHCVASTLTVSLQ